jgi:hypothetical protein
MPLIDSVRLMGSFRFAAVSQRSSRWHRSPRGCAKRSSDHAPVKRGLHHAALATPQVALAGHDPVAEQQLDALDAGALDVVAMIRHEDALDILGVMHDPCPRRTGGRVHPIRVAVLAEPPHHQIDRLVGRADVVPLADGGRQFVLWFRRCGSSEC